MYTYWALVKTGAGAYMKVTVQAPNPWVAYQMLKSMYGANLMSESAALA